MKTIIAIVYFIAGQGYYLYESPQKHLATNQVAIAIVEKCKCPTTIKFDNYDKLNSNTPIPIGDTVWVNGIGCSKIVEYANK